MEIDLGDRHDVLEHRQVDLFLMLLNLKISIIWKFAKGYILCKNISNKHTLKTCVIVCKMTV